MRIFACGWLCRREVQSNLRVKGEPRRHLEPEGCSPFRPMERGRFEEVDVDAIGRNRVNVFRQRTDQPRSLPFAAGIHVRGLLFAVRQQGVVTKTLRASLICQGDVVDGLLNFRDVLLLLRIEQMETLAQEGPKSIAAQLFQFRVQHVGLGGDTTNSIMEIEPPGFSHLS